MKAIVETSTIDSIFTFFSQNESEKKTCQRITLAQKGYNQSFEREIMPSRQHRSAG